MRGNLPHQWPHLRCGTNMQRSSYMVSRGNLLFPNHMVHAHLSPPVLLRKMYEMPLIGYNLGRRWWIGWWSLYLCPLLAHIFNKAMCEGFLTRWIKHTIVPILKSGDPIMPRNYRTIMIGHYLAKLYGSIQESELSIWAKQNGCRSTGQASFRKGFTTLDHILTLRALIEEGRAHNKRIYCCFVEFLWAMVCMPP